MKRLHGLDQKAALLGALLLLPTSTAWTQPALETPAQVQNPAGNTTQDQSQGDNQVREVMAQEPTQDQDQDQGQQQNQAQITALEGLVEQATGPAELLTLASREQLSVRALLGFDRVPKSTIKLALDLRAQGVDLLGADLAALRGILTRAETGALATDPEPLRALVALMEARGYLDWQPLPATGSLTLGEQTLLRGDGRLTLQLPSGATLRVAPANSTLPLAPLLRLAEQEAALSTPLYGDRTGVIWRPSHGMRLIGSPIKGATADGGDAGSAGATARPDDVQATRTDATLVGTRDGGYLIAGSIQTADRQELWVARFDARGLPRWTRTFSDGLALGTSAITELADGALLIAGELPAQQQTYLIALEPNGEPRWSGLAAAGDVAATPQTGTAATEAVRQASTGPRVRLSALAPTADGGALAAGQQRAADGTAAALVLRLSAGGDRVWQQTLADVAQISAIVADQDAWLLAGSAATTAPTAWVARLGDDGSPDWQHRLDPAADGGALALARQADGRILVAGQGAQGDSLWLADLGPDGTPETAVRRLVIPIDGGAQPRRLLGAAIDATGDLWLSGVTAGGDAWLARVTAAGELRWGRAYGHRGADQLSAVLPRDAGAVAIGRSAGTAAAGDALWLVRVDADGLPLPTPELSAQAQALSTDFVEALSGDLDPLQLGAPPEISESASGRLDIALPFVRFEGELPDQDEPATVDLGTLHLGLQPLAESGVWSLELDWPARFAIRDRSGRSLGTLAVPRREARIAWGQTDGLPRRIDLLIEALDLHLESAPQLAGLAAAAADTATPAAAADPDTFGRMRLGAFELRLAPEGEPQTRWTGTQLLRAADWSMTNRDGTERGRCGELRLDLGYQDLDPVVLQTRYAQLLELLQGTTPVQTDGTPLAPRRLVEELLAASGGGHSQVLLRDLAVYRPEANSEESFVIAELRVTNSGNPTDAQRQHWDLTLGYGVRGLKLVTLGQETQLGATQVDLTVRRLAVASLLDTLAALSSGQAPAAQSMLELQQQSLAAVELKASTENLTDGETLRLESAELRLALPEAAADDRVLALQYAHRGLSALPEVPPEITPRTLTLDLALSGLNPEALTPAFAEGEPDPAILLALLAAEQTRLRVEKLDIQLPEAGLELAGNAWAELTQDAEPTPYLSADFQLQVKAFDRLVEILTALADPAERENLLATAALLKLAGEQVTGDDGAPAYRFHLTANSLGQAQLNGKDLTPLIQMLQ